MPPRTPDQWLEKARRRLAGRRVVVTGASSGIGAAFVTAMAPADVQFVLVARSKPALTQVAERARELGSQAELAPLDLLDLEAGRAAAERISAGGPVDLLFSNAGLSIARSVQACVGRPDSIWRSAGVNYTGAVGFALPIIAAMVARGEGHLVGSSTVNARMVLPGWGPYAASKAAWESWLRTADAELRGLGVPVTSVAFPLVATPMAAPTYGSRPRGAISPQRAAGLVARAVVTQEPRVAPAWLPMAEVATAAAPVTSARLIGRFSMRKTR